MKERGIERLIFLILFVFLELEGTSALTKKVLLRSKQECYTNDVHVIGENFHKYQISLSLSKYNCSQDQRGFSCSQAFIREEDSFANIGTRLCVDIQGIQDQVHSTKLIYTVRDKNTVLKRVYSSTVLKPRSNPYYVCTTTDSDPIQLSLSVRQQEYVCPDILNHMFDNVIKMGTVMALPLSPIVEVKMDSCYMESMPDSDSFLVKLYTTGAIGQCHLAKRLLQSYSYVRVCLKLEYYSPDFECPIMLRIYSEGGDDDNELSLVLSRRPGSDEQICETYSGRHGRPVLSIKNYLTIQETCKGNIAFRVDIRGTSPPADDESSQSSPNLYMAVFITLIAICLVCLGLTCLCCIRYRAKRQRRLQQRSNHRRNDDFSVPNQGFDGPAPYDNPISWSPTEPGMLFGLPSYDDVFGGNGVNPSDDPHKDDLPPAYDTVFGSSEI